MELWLLALVALALIPTVRLFMAASCRRAAQPPGTRPLTVEVSETGANPNDPPEPDATVIITSGNVEVHPPSGSPTPSAGVPAGGLFPGHEFPVTEEMFAGTASPYQWTANCTISYQCTDGPSALRGTGTLSAVHAWDWDANRDLTVRFLLRMVDDAREGGTTIPDPTIVHRYRWEFSGG
jgi:hypothetical protein